MICGCHWPGAPGKQKPRSTEAVQKRFTKARMLGTHQPKLAQSVSLKVELRAELGEFL
jgi:hypothetical protein